MDRNLDMKITSIKQQIKRSDRYSIYIDNAYVCSFSEGELIKLGLRIGQEVSEAELRALKDDAIRDKAYDRTLNLISRRPRSEWELRDYLKRKGYEPEVTEVTMGRLAERGYVNDLDFARRWVENRRLLKPTSKRRLAQELKQKQIADEIITIVLDTNEIDERQILRDLVVRKRARYPDQTKFMQYLARQGYSYDDIKSVLSEE